MTSEGYQNLKIGAVIVAVMSLVAIGPWPYGYYTLLRIAVMGVGAWGAYVAFEEKLSLLPWFLVGAAILWNPIIPVYLERETWAVLNIGAAVLFGVLAGLSAKRSNRH